MKKLILAAAILGMTNFAFGQQAASASKDTKSAKSCNGKCCKKGGSCTKGSKSASSATSATTISDKK